MKPMMKLMKWNDNKIFGWHLVFSIKFLVTYLYDPGLSSLGVHLPDFGRSVNPILTRGSDYAHRNTTGTPGFSDLPTALQLKEHNT